MNRATPTQPPPRVRVRGGHDGRALLALATAIVVTADAHPAAAGGVTFVDIAASSDAGIDYRRTRSPREAIFDQLKARPSYTFADLLTTPIMGRGQPGTGIFDFDGDGDRDIYVTNGPGTANSLYANQLVETGALRFVDVAVAMGADLTDQDSAGVCIGDIDNDGRDDLLVLGTGEPNRLLRNDGAGGFTDITALGDIGGGDRSPSSCSMGDVDGDGLLDVVVGNTSVTWDDQLSIHGAPFAYNDHNQLFLNQGGGVFVDATAASGLLDTAGFRPSSDGEPTVSWAIAMVDIDLDGDIDIIHGDDQAGILPYEFGGVDRGLIHVFVNDGTGRFTDVSAQMGTATQGAWMGLAFGDLDCDGRMDMFASNGGDYMLPTIMAPYPYAAGQWGSRWFLGQPGGTFSDPGVGDLVASAFGWGAGIADYDSDGDLDIVYHGGLDQGFIIEASNAGVILQNQGCSADFVHDTDALSATDHQRRTVTGLSLGDLDDDGFTDIVTVSNADHPAPIQQLPVPVQYGAGAFDDAAYVQTFTPIGPGVFRFSGVEFTDGTLSVEINSGDAANRWIKVEPLGSVGIATEGVANRGGVGAVITVTPHGGDAAMRPVTAGASFGSTHSRELSFGLGGAHHATVEVLWPGGARNRLYGVAAGTRLVFPEIPCSFADSWSSLPAYLSCVVGALNELEAGGVVDTELRVRLSISALIAVFDAD